MTCHSSAAIVVRIAIEAFGGPPLALFVDGRIERFEVTSGDIAARLGFDIGFGRHQFTRASEAFIRSGESYCGYLDAATYVDGAGRVRLEQIKGPRELVCR